MRAFDMTPILRTTVGFDRLARTLSGHAGDHAPAYPPYNIEKLSGDAYLVSIAVAGFSPDDLDITIQENSLTVKGTSPRSNDGDDETVYLHRGLAARNFERRFSLAEHIEVAEARLENGLLSIALQRNVPEAAKPKRIAISAGKPKAGKTLEAKAA